MGGPSVHALGYGFLLSPVAINLLVLLLIAVAFNFLFPWRRYPLGAMRRQALREEAMIPHSDLVYALSQIDSFIDVEEEDLLRIYALATGRRGDAFGCGTQE